MQAPNPKHVEGARRGWRRRKAGEVQKRRLLNSYAHVLADLKREREAIRTELALIAQRLAELPVGIMSTPVVESADGSHPGAIR